MSNTLPAFDLERLSRSDMQLIRRAIRNDWPLSAEIREEAVIAARKILKGARSHRDKLAAIKILAEADKMNALRERMDQRDKHKVMPSLVNVNVTHKTDVQELTDDELMEIAGRNKDKAVEPCAN